MYTAILIDDFRATHSLTPQGSCARLDLILGDLASIEILGQEYGTRFHSSRRELQRSMHTKTLDALLSESQRLRS